MVGVTDLEGASQAQFKVEGTYGSHPGGGSAIYLAVRRARVSLVNTTEQGRPIGAQGPEWSTDTKKFYKITIEFFIQSLEIFKYVLGSDFALADAMGSITIEFKSDLATDEYLKCLGCKIDSAQIIIDQAPPCQLIGVLNIVCQNIEEAAATGFSADATRVTTVPVLYSECDLQVNSATVENLQKCIIEIRRNLNVEHVIKNTNGDLIVEPEPGHREMFISITELYEDKTHFTRVLNATQLTNFIATFPSAKVGAGNDVWTFTTLDYPDGERPFDNSGQIKKPGYTLEARSLAIA